MAVLRCAEAGEGTVEASVDAYPFVLLFIWGGREEKAGSVACQEASFPFYVLMNFFTTSPSNT